MLEHTIFLIVIVGLLGLADYTLTRIFIKGSVFESFRRVLKDKSQNGYIRKKIHELFSCHLCLGAQLSLWILSLPLHIYHGSPLHYFVRPEFGLVATGIFYLGSWFILGMCITAIHYWIWDKTVDKPIPKKDTLPEELIALLSTKTAVQNEQKLPETTKKVRDIFSNNELALNFSGKKISLAEFTFLLFVCQYACGNYRCPIARPDCIRMIVVKFTEGKLMRVLDLIGIGKIPEDLCSRLERNLFRVIDDSIDLLRNKDEIKLGTPQWFKEANALYTHWEVASISF